MYYIMIMNKEIMLPLFKPLLRPIIEFGNIVCVHHVYETISHSRKSYTENMQRCFSKCNTGMNNLEYKQRPMALKLPSLEHRRARGHTIETLTLYTVFMILKLFLVQLQAE